MKRTLCLLLCLFLVSATALPAPPLQQPQDTEDSDSRMNSATFKGLKMRGIGPAFMSGRIADLVIHPEDESIWYVAAGSGGVWKSVNAGTTWTSIFEGQGSYSIGCLSLDPSNPHVLWVGTGEDVGGRHVGYGDGIYRSDDGGKSWRNMGLKDSQHIARIIVSPEDSDVIYVAAQGPLWSPGGERGFFKSSDGGQTWKKTLGDEEWTGVTDIVADPRDPNRVYAATWQHHRTVAAYMGGGPESAIHRSEDGGETWSKLSKGLPEGPKGKIGLAISHQQPDVVYAAIELKRKTGAVYRSTDRGESWEKRSDTVSGGTGPHYYQELYASPHHFDRLYLMDAWMQFSVDGGKTFQRINREHRHGDNHALAFKPSDPDYIMVGTDGGVYESFDLADNWRYIQNLPLTQFYKVALDDAEPFYNIYGGTQDNGTQGGPSRTDNVHGIQNSDWSIVLNWDGHQPATEPGNPDIIYGERQQGTLSRIDISTGEVVDIQPQPGADEDYERFNWDAPILVSPHDPARIYFASQRLWRSDNRGDEWRAVSGDLTRDQERITLPIMGKQQSWDSAWDVGAMSNYNTITSIAESPQFEGLLYVGTDDGLLQVSENGGDSWRAVEVGSMPDVPGTAFVNDIKADLHDADSVYVALDNHKYGDLTPYLLKSSDRGATWTSIRGDLPDRTLVWRVVQDHVKPELLFAATEFGIYFTVDAGGSWIKLEGGMPTISFRDLAIQRRENDLVGASFGRGFYVLDDYSSLRAVSEETLAAEAALFPTRQAWWYFPRPDLSFDDEKGSQGASHFVAPNPPFGAVFTYHLRDGLQTREQRRQETEKQLEAGQDVPFPGWDALSQEIAESDPKIWIIVKDSQGNTVRRVSGPVGKGLHRVAWDLRYPSPQALRTGSGSPSGPQPSGMMAAPGTYSATLSKEVGGEITSLGASIEFEVVPLMEGALEGSSPAETAAFWRAYEGAVRVASAVNQALGNELARLQAMKTALQRTPAAPGQLDTRLNGLRNRLLELQERLFGNRAKNQIGEKTRPTVGSRLFAVQRGIERSTYGPTATHRQQLEIINNQLEQIKSDLESARSQADALGQDLQQAGAPWVEGNRLPR
ncbi:MAG TPA: glycosyl hydrolase [Acidobacteriota bacterium]|nr:glycosyl hydrolase [Acidobacteriota bacterium]